MLKLPKPTTCYFQAHRDSISDKNPISGIYSTYKKTIINSIFFFNAIYHIKGVTASLNTLPVLSKVYGIITAKEMENLYTKGMVKLVKGREHYDEIYDASLNNVCPLCALRKINTLDHYLPKAHYPQYAIMPINLYPCCTDCNNAKRDKYQLPKNSQTIHPYFDDIVNIRWLRARIFNTPKVRLEYYVDTPPGTPALLKERIENHFNTLEIKSLYESHAATLLISEKYFYCSLKLDSTKNLIATLTLRKTSISRVNINQWDAVYYEALLASQEFIDEWHKEIEEPQKVS